MEHLQSADPGVQFSLSMTFTDDDLKRLGVGNNIIVAKPTGGSSPNVAWVVYRPLNVNSIQWQEDYGIYASNVEIQNGALLTQMSQTPYPAAASKLYTMTPNGNIAGPGSGGTPNSYAIVNQYDNLDTKGYLTFGLFQAATVNGDQVSNAVSAATVLYKSTAVMTTFTTVYLWVQSQVISNTVVTNVTSPMTQVTLSGDSPSAKLAYDASSGTFLPVGGRMAVGEGGVKHILPTL